MPVERRLFISYSHFDQVWHDRLIAHLGALDDTLNPWSDERIRTGTSWREEIEAALIEADAAILIVTPHFLSSSFIKNEEIPRLLQRRADDGIPVFAIIAEPSLWRRFAWLESMQVVRLADRDLPQPSSYDIDQKLAALVEEIDEALASATPTEQPDWHIEAEESDRERRPPLSSEERVERIRELLQEPPGDSIDGLPAGLLELITDQSQLPLLEEKLTPEAPFLEAANAVKAIGMLADWAWDHRVVKSEASVAKLTSFYETTEDRRLRSLIIDTLFKFDAPEIPFDFVVDRLEQDPVQLKAAILAEMQFYVDRPYLADLIETRVLPLLHEFCTYPLRESIYSDEWHGEEDFRFWVFRCLGGIGRLSSAPVIEEYLASHDWPLGTLAEAANAHWDITHSTRYLDVLRRAEAEGALGNTEHALREMEQFLEEQEQESS